MHQQDSYQGPERRAHPDVIDLRLRDLHEDVADIKLVLKDLTSAITRLALVEERMGASMAAQERAFESMADIEKRVTEIEKRLPEYTRASIWIDRGVWAAAAAAVVYVAKKVGLV